MINRFLYSLLFLLICWNGTTQISRSLIPEPVIIKEEKGNFKISSHTKIITGEKENIQKVGELFSAQIASLTGKQLSCKTKEKGKNIFLVLNAEANDELGKEGYTLDVEIDKVQITANEPAGLFYGLQSLRQLILLNAIPKEKNKYISIPAMSIVDYPRFKWRGIMLDVSRHFFDKKFIKKYIDQMAEYKYNVFHWHLTDDPGWRIEIKKYPKLTETGSLRVPRTGVFYSYPNPKPEEEKTYGGYYTQEDIREIVQYAAERFISIVPEIDIPGHSRSFIAAYPESSCSGNNTTVYAGEISGPGENVLCAGNENNFKMLNDILDEVSTLFPGPYIHIGGDEVNKDFWHNCPKCRKTMEKNHLKDEHELQSYFIKRVEKIVESKGKQLIGWDEIVEGGLAPNATVMSWRGIEGGIHAASQGHEVIMTPTDYCYLDYVQGEPILEGFPPLWSRLNLTKVYSFEPVPDGIETALVLGGQGNVWTEHIQENRQVEYMTWPRALALSEVLWSPKEKRNLPDFLERMEKNLLIFDKMETNYSRCAFDPYIKLIKTDGGIEKLEFGSEIPNLDIYYSFNFAFPDKFSAKYDGTPVPIPTGAVEIKAITYRHGKPVGRLLRIPISDLQINE